MRALLTLALIASVLFSRSIYADESSQLRVKQVLYPIVRVTTNNSGGASGTILFSEDREGDGKFKTFIITNYHVIDSAVHITKEWDNLLNKYVEKEDNDLVNVDLFKYENNNKTVLFMTLKANIIAYKKEEDLALIQLVYDFKIDNVAHLLPREKTLDLFQEVMAVGCQALADPFPTIGIITDLEVMIDKKIYVQSSAPTYFGSSGSAVFTKVDSKYYFIGIPSRIAVQRGQALNHMGFFIPPDRIYEFIETQKLLFLIDSKISPKQSMEDRKKISNGENNK